MADPVLHGGAFIDGRDKVLRPKIKKACRRRFRKNCTALKLLPRNSNFKHLKAW